MKCPQCSFDNPAGFAFCGNCGSRLSALPTPSTPTTSEERKIVTILFADVTGSTSLGERLDPERVRAIMGRFFEVMAEIVHRFGGTVEKFIGDEVMAVFGLPAAHEDDPERAVRAAAAMHQRLADLNVDLRLSGASGLQMRIGINTGEVVANPDAVHKGEFMVTGDAVNVAARLRSAAAPSTTLVGDRTYRHTQWLVEFRESVPLALKGKTELVRGWEFVSLRSEPASRRGGLRAPLVGRHGEVAALRKVLDDVVGGHAPRLVTIVGAPGVGKSRLFEELVAAHPELTVRQGRSLPYGGTSLWAMGEIVRADCGILRSDPLSIMVDKLRSRVSMLFPGEQVAGEAAQVLAQLSRMLAIRTSPDRMSEDDSRETLFWSLRRYVEAVAAANPLVLGFEDLHSADTELMDLVEYIAASNAPLPLLIVCLTRPDLLHRRPGWGGSTPHSLVLPLGPLPEAVIAGLAAGLLNTERPPDELSAALTVAEGNPFFVEEILRMLIDTGSLTRSNGGWQLQGPLSIRIPDTVQGVVASRLDQLSRDEKIILLEAAILGKDFWIGALSHLTREREEHLTPLLRDLAYKDFVIEREQSRLEGQREYTFKHLIIHDVAYGMLPKSRRAERHAAFGRWLEQTLGERAEEFAELLAHHWQQALQLTRELGDAGWTELAPFAVRFTLMAGRKSARLYAHEQAIAHFTAARALADEIADDANRVAAIEGLGDIYALQARWDEASRLYQHALEFHERKGDAVRQAHVQSRIGSTFSGVFDFRQALPHIQSAMETLQSHRDERELAGIYLQMARTHTAMGQLAEAEAYARNGVHLAEQHGLLPQLAEGEWALAFISTLLGRADAAQRYERCIDIAERVGDRVWVIQGLAWKAFRHRWRGEYEEARESYARALALAEETRNRPRIAFCLIGTGETHFLCGDWHSARETWARYLQMGGEVPAWVEHVRATIAFMEGHFEDAVTWAEKFVAHAERRREVTSIVLAMDRCASHYLRVGRIEDARQLLAEALDQFGSLFWSVFFHPLAAEAALAAGEIDSALSHCERAEALPWTAVPSARARVLRAKALVYHARGEWDQAITLAKESAGIYRQIGQLYDCGRTLEMAARLHSDRGGHGDSELASTLDSDARALYEQVGAHFELRRMLGPASA